MKRGIVLILAALSLLIMASQSTGEMKITPEGVTFPNATTQTMAATPPWSQKLSAADRFQLVMGTLVPIPTPHFEYEAVLDKETGLVWQRDTDDFQRSCSNACSYCYQLSLGGRKGWRLPTVEELASLVDPSQVNPALPEGHLFTNVKLSDYWSSTTYASNPDGAWYVGFVAGGVYITNKTEDNYVRCVRGGHGYDAW